jgi:hypothetical protein
MLLAKRLAFGCESRLARGDLSAVDDTRVRVNAALSGLARSLGCVDAAARQSMLGSLFGGRDIWQLPAHMLPVAELLYMLQRGAMFGQVVGHTDERQHLLHLFLKYDMRLARPMMQPSAYQVRCHAINCAFCCLPRSCNLQALLAGRGLRHVQPVMLQKHRAEPQKNGDRHVIWTRPIRWALLCR